MAQAIFYFFAALSLASALFILFTRNVMRAAFALLLCLLGVAACFVFAGADVVAVSQLMLYVGGVLVIIVFGVMFTSDLSGQAAVTGHHYRLAAAVAALALLGLLLYGLWKANFALLAHAPTAGQSTLRRMGHLLMTDYLLPLELAGLLLLVALVGTAYIAGKK